MAKGALRGAAGPQKNHPHIRIILKQLIEVVKSLGHFVTPVGAIAANHTLPPVTVLWLTIAYGGVSLGSIAIALGATGSFPSR